MGDGRSAREFETRDVRLAAALMAVGVPPRGDGPVQVVTRASQSGEARQFIFAPRSECGEYDTRELVAAWRAGPKWIEANPLHPFAIAMAAMQNHRHLVDYVKRASKMVFIQEGRSIALLPLEASAELEAKILGQFGR